MDAIKIFHSRCAHQPSGTESAEHAALLKGFRLCLAPVPPLRALIGRVASITVDKLEIQVIIKDVKNAYGVDRLLIEPAAGKGQVWVNAERVTLER